MLEKKESETEDKKEENLIFDDGSSSGAELYIEEQEEEEVVNNIEQEEIEDDKFLDNEDNVLEKNEDDQESYNQLKQQLIEEYDNNKNFTQPQSIEQEDIEENWQSEDSGDLLAKAAEEVEKENEINSDENIEIEDIQEDLENGEISRPRSMLSPEESVTPDIDDGASKVAISRGSSIAFLVGVILFLGFVIYKIMQPSAEELEAQKSSINKNAPIVTPPEDIGQTIVVPEIPKFPDMPVDLPTPAPKALPTPPTPPTLEVISPPPAPLSGDISNEKKNSTADINSFPSIKGFGDIVAIDKDAANKAAAEAARKQTRIKSSMMLASGGNKNNKNVNSEGQTLSILQRNNDQIVATHIGELQRIIASGKIIDAVLETAINTDLPGMIRAVVSRDVYSEAGNNILINKGSRLIGSYSSTIKYGQARVQIVWNRVIRPDGIDVKVDSPGIDDIGRSGVGGDVDNHILRNFITATMVSLIDIGIAEYAEKNGSSGSTSSTTTTNTDGSTTTNDNSTATDKAYDEAVDNISSIGKDVMEKTMDMPPTITINQGTSLKVFVKRDLIFPGRSANLTRLVE